MQCTKKFTCPKLKMPSFGHVRQKCCQIFMPKSGADFHTSLHCWQIYVKLCVCRLWGREVASFCNGKAPQWLPVITILDNCDFNLGSFLITTSLKSQFLRWHHLTTICEYSLPVIIMPMRRTLRYCTLWYSFKPSWSDMLQVSWSILQYMLEILMMRAHIKTCESHLEFMHDCKNDGGRRQFKSCPKLCKSKICNMQLFKEWDQS